MNNLTKLFCDLISIGSQLNDSSVKTEEIARYVQHTAFRRLPEDCDVDLGAIEDHIESIRTAIRGSNHDIDIRSRLAQGKPLSIRDIVEFHGKLIVKFNNGSDLTFESSESTHY